MMRKASRVPENLYERARRLGIQFTYRDAAGNEQTIDDAILPDLVAALSSNAETVATAQKAPAVRMAPSGSAYQPGFAQAGERCWLLAVQLYSLQTPENWGHGDFGDLTRLLEIVACAGGDGIGLNPLHLLFEDRPEEASPYAPSSRRFLNPLYLDIAQLPGIGAIERMKYRPDRSHDGPLIDYASVAEAKYDAFRIAYRQFRAEPTLQDAEAFALYKREMGWPLRQFAVFTFLRRRYGSRWRDWPARWRNADRAAIEHLAAEEAGAIDFQEFLQWQAHEQLSRCAALGRELGLRVGLYMDLAVGVHPDGFDAWSLQDVFLDNIVIGAPPDPLNQLGQNWGLTAFNPGALRALDCAPFREMLAAIMRYAGAIRFDHILGLNRLYLIPENRTGREGAYVTLPLTDLINLLCAESRAHECLVIGEDLGTVPNGFRETLRAAGIWTFLVMLFSRDEDGAFLPPEDYAAQGLATFATHDLPTLRGWLDGRDLEVLSDLHIPAAETMTQRRASLQALVAAMDEAGIPPGEMFERVSCFLARAPSGVLSISLEDVLGVREQVNLPGTHHEYPNWRRRLPFEADDLRERLERLGRTLASEGRGQSIFP